MLVGDLWASRLGHLGMVVWRVLSHVALVGRVASGAPGQRAIDLLVDAMGSRHDRLSVDQGAATLVLGNLDVHLVGKLAVSGALAANNAPLRRLNGAAAHF